jgi:hypothetical protein
VVFRYVCLESGSKPRRILSFKEYLLSLRSFAGKIVYKGLVLVKEQPPVTLLDLFSMDKGRSQVELICRKGLSLPAKWFAVGQCWRYERTTRGRRREHYQWNMDIFGVPGVEVRPLRLFPSNFAMKSV